MSKQIKTTDTNLEVNTSQIMVVEVGDFSFEVDERYPWVDVYAIGDDKKKFVCQIDYDDMPIFAEFDDLKVFALNWYFDNVQIVKEV